MYIEKIAIENYKSYLHPQEIQFTTGFNVVVGMNNAGKTALLEALSLQIENKPHASLETIPVQGQMLITPSQVHITFSIAQEEVMQVLQENKNQLHLRIKSERHDIVKKLLSMPAIHLNGTYQSKNCILGEISNIEQKESKTANLFSIEGANVFPQGENGVHMLKKNQLFSDKLISFCEKRIYYFKAERLNIAQSQMGQDALLKSNASNLAEVLNLLLTSNPARFDKLVDFVKTIFPDIKYVAVPPASSSEAKILLWHFDKSTERKDLAVPLQESGTGIGQVLAILYVVVNSDFPRCIVIDEPQSFLHPSAIRKLFNILRVYYPQHQYIVTTHSPVVISAANPNKLILLKKVNVVTQVENIPVSEKNGLSLLLEELGARLSDVFGADNVLWVEGATEESCFPLIVQKILKKPLLGTAILGVLSVGELEGKHSEKVWKIYQRLSKGKALIPPAIGFIFDREGRSEEDIARLERESDGQVHFLSRRMYENYLLNPEAIAAVISQLENFGSQPIEAQAIGTWIEKYRADNSSTDKNPESWIVNVHAGKLLNALFIAFSEGRYSYDSDKAYYGLQLTSWLIENRPDDLSEIKELLNTVLGTAQSE